MTAVEATGVEIYTPKIEHHPFDKKLWEGRLEPYESDRARYWYQLVTAYSNQKIGLIGFACDQGVRRNLGRVGAKAAPKTIRKAFAKLPCSLSLQNAYCSYKLTNDLVELVGDAGDVYCEDGNNVVDGLLESTQSVYAQRVTEIIHQGSLAIGLGGGHAIAFASYLGLWNAFNDPNKHNKNSSSPGIGIINFDAHLDLRNASVGSSGTPFRQIAEHSKSNGQIFKYCAIGISDYSNTAALFDRARELDVTVIKDNDCLRLPWEGIEQQLDSFINQVDMIYLTIDMDVLDASVVPGVSAPAAKGLSLDFVERCIEYIFSKEVVRMADIAEINPTYDIDGRSSKVAARLLALMIDLYLKKSN